MWSHSAGNIVGNIITNTSRYYKKEEKKNILLLIDMPKSEGKVFPHLF